MRIGILTVSDLGAMGQRADTSGDAIVEWAGRHGYEVAVRSVVPDETDRIAGKLARWADSGEVDVILTTGGTGLTARDVTPEATEAVVERLAPGIAEALRAAAAPRFPRAWLSRGVAGTRGKALIVNLPGSTGGVTDVEFQFTGEALASYLQTVGIRSRIRTMERATLTTAWREKKLKGLIVGITGAGGNAATRLEAYVSKEGAYTAGVLPEVEDLFQRQARETDVKRREALIHQIQQILHDRVTHVPIYELAFTWGIGPRMEEPGISLIRGYAYSAPYEDLKLKRQ